MSRFEGKNQQYRTLEEIEEIAVAVRLLIGLDSVLPFLRFCFLLEKLSILAPGFSSRVISDDDLDCAAKVFPDRKEIHFRRSLFYHGRRGDPHALMCLLHELSHILLGHTGVRCKIPGLDIRYLKDLDEKRDEWEANRLAGAILMPANDGANFHTDAELAQRFDVTVEAAKYRRPQIEEMLRRRGGTLRALPSSVVRFLWEEKARTGLVLESLQNEDQRRRAEAKANGLSGQACTRCGYFNIVCGEGVVECGTCGQTQ